MYVDSNNFEKQVLRQGDIVRNVKVLGALNPYGISVHLNDNNEPTGWSSTQILKFADVIVMSHSCEIEPKNKIKLTSIILAPLRNIDGATSPEKKQDLIDSNYLKPGTEASFLKYFYLIPNPELEHQNGAIVDFSKCFSVRNKCYRNLVENKIMQLDIEAASAMALKFGVYFHREYSKDSA